MSQQQQHDDDLTVDLVDLDLDAAQVRLLTAIQRQLNRRSHDIMAAIDDINALVTQTGADAQASADRVTRSLADAAAQIADLQAQVAALSAGSVTPEQLQSISDGLAAIDATVKGTDPAA